MAERAIRAWVDEHLITEQGIRGQVLKSAGASEGLDNAAIQQLIDAHLVRGEQRRGATWFELAHDRLVEPVRQNNAAWREANLSMLQRQAALWEQEKRPEGLLLRGDELREAEAWAAAHAGELTEVEQAFLEACRQARAAEQRERRTRRIIMMAAVVAFLFALVAAGAAWVAVEALDSAKKQLNASQIAIQSQTSDDPEIALLLAIEAAEIDQNMLIKEVLKQAIQSSRVRVRLMGHKYGVISAAFSRDGKYIVTASYDRTARVWNATFSSDGDYIVTASGGSDGDFTARIWEVNANTDNLPEDFEDLLNLAKSHVTRDLTPRERELYLSE